ncbi:hypothetical protein [Paenibacillus pini]|uniref:Membrane protein NfeD2 N-terminal transmembrane domain-containing protein n=1 Tax=Paenibacillus pini JCM 16418 TaxID=1236976 RepID=W7YQI6_9BACL|nr:hypothetical protein [Paenibacillus pini]GAF06866.1 hypothetical protein JCM16418_850 [Paenibacillus pini JCM 16418]
METLYWSCLAGGVIFALVTVLLGDVLSHVLHGFLDFLSIDFLKPMVLASAITAFGGSGILLTSHSGLGAVLNMIVSILIGIVIAWFVYWVYIKPMQNSENSTGYSIKEMTGRIGIITIPLPAEGFGEVMVKVGASNTLHIASSFDHHSLPAGVRVVVVDIVDQVLRVSELEERKGDVV